jgi:hypothetical protein
MDTCLKKSAVKQGIGCLEGGGKSKKKATGHSEN